MIFDYENVLIDEKKAEINDKWFVNVNDEYLIVKNIPFEPDDKLLKFFDLNGEFLKDEWPVEMELLEYDSFPGLSYNYSSSELLFYDNEIYLFFRWLPCYLKYSLQTKKSEFVNFESKMPFKPTRPSFKHKDGYYEIGGVFMQMVAKQNEEGFLVYCGNRKSAKEDISKIKLYLYWLSKTDNSVELIDLLVDGEKLIPTIHKAIFVTEDYLLIFDEEEENLRVYKIK